MTRSDEPDSSDGKGADNSGDTGWSTVTQKDAISPPPQPSTCPPLLSGEDAVALIEPPRTTPLRPTWLIAALASGVAADLALRRPPWNNLAFTLLIVVVALGLASSGFIRTKAAQIMLAGSVVFGLLLAVRTEVLLTVFNFAAASTLLIGAALVGQDRDIWNIGPIRVVTDALAVLEKAVTAPIVIGQESYNRYRLWESSDATAGKAVVRGLAIAVPLVLVLGVLLASADAVFQSFFTGLNIGGGSIVGHLILTGLGVCGFVALLGLAAATDEESAISGPKRSLGAVETGIILGAIIALFSVFAVAQVLTIVGGADEALTRAGVDPKEFARQGFFQLIWVALITVAVVMSIRVLAGGDDRASAFARIGGYATSAMTMMIVVVAVARITFYISADGMTPRRLYAFVVCVWIGVSLLLLVARLTGWKNHKSWLTTATATAAVVLLLSLNAVNPQRLIADNHLDRRSVNVAYHVAEGQFQGEGLARLVAGLDRFDPEVTDEAIRLICQDAQGNSDEPDWLEFNWGRNQARTATAELCG